jgi:hypothetical protein
VYKGLTDYREWLFTYFDLENQQIPGQPGPGQPGQPAGAGDPGRPFGGGRTDGRGRRGSAFGDGSQGTAPATFGGGSDTPQRQSPPRR